MSVHMHYLNILKIKTGVFLLIYKKFLTTQKRVINIYTFVFSIYIQELFLQNFSCTLKVAYDMGPI